MTNAANITNRTHTANVTNITNKAITDISHIIIANITNIYE